MIYLLIVSLIWAFSFGLIKGNLSGLNPNFVAWGRLLISLLVFLPFLNLKSIDRRTALRLMIVGICQYGIMYLSYIYSFQFLQAYEVALFTIFTPIYVTLFNDFFYRRFHKMNLLTALLAVIGSGIVVYQSISRNDFLFGFLIVQISNICFAFGQVYYREIMKSHKGVKDVQIFGLLYFGAVLISSLAAGITTDWSGLTLSSTHVLTLLYLGVLASGIGFFLWNFGARRVEGGTLAVFNNLKVPLAVAVSLAFFNESGNIPRLIIGGALVLTALFLNQLDYHREQAHRTQLSD